MTPHPRTWGTIALLTALTLSTAAAAQEPSPAPLSVGVLVDDSGERASLDALHAILARSPNVDVRDASVVRAAHGATRAGASEALERDPARAVALMTRASIESLLIVRAKGDELSVSVMGPDGELLTTVTRRGLAPSNEQAREIIQRAFDVAAPATLAWRGRGGRRAPSPTTTPATDAAPPAGTSGTAATLAPSSTVREEWVASVGLQTGLIEDPGGSLVVFGSQLEFTNESVGGWEEDAGFALSLSFIPPQNELVLVRADARALGVVFIDEVASPEVVVGGVMALRDAPTLGGLVFSFGPILGGGVRVNLGEGRVLRSHAIGGLEISPGYAFGAFWEARLEANVPLGEDGLVMSPRVVRRTSLLAVSALDERILTRWEFSVLFGFSF